MYIYTLFRFLIIINSPFEYVILLFITFLIKEIFAFGFIFLDNEALSAELSRS
jgi:hypothetical protein